MKLNRTGCINVVVAFIRDTIDIRATVSYKTKQPVIHFALPNGEVYGYRHGLPLPKVVYKTITEQQASAFCADMGWTHNNVRYAHHVSNSKSN